MVSRADILRKSLKGEVENFGRAREEKLTQKCEWKLFAVSC